MSANVAVVAASYLRHATDNNKDDGNIMMMMMVTAFGRDQFVPLLMSLIWDVTDGRQ